MTTPALIGLGSNLGDRRAHLDAAVAALADTPGVAVRAVSSYHGTEPVGGPPGQGGFLNAAVLVDASLDPPALLARLHEIEAREGRVRAVRWGERTLDLDLLLFGDRVIDTPELTVPHLRMPVRRFVLAPAVEIAPAMVDPLTGRSLADLLANLDRRPSVLGLSRSIVGLDAVEARLRDELEGWLVLIEGSRGPGRPTFVAVAGPEADVPLECGPAGSTPILRIRGVSSLPPGSATAAIVEEIRAACRASRSG
jgi:2-amino-4-hydroxy-6-hydroxymethyldihydropteridine diphosphokinase